MADEHQPDPQQAEERVAEERQEDDLVLPDEIAEQVKGGDGWDVKPPNKST